MKVIERVKALLRVATFGAVVSGGLGLFAARSVYGDVGESSMAIGRELSGIEALSGGAHRVRLNGETVTVAAATLALDHADVLDRFEALCRKGSQGLELAVSDPANGLPADVRAALEKGGPATAGVMRREGSGEGIVTCLLRPEGEEASAAATFERLTHFAKSKDLGDLGRLRYVYVKSLGKGRSHVVAAATDGSLRIDRIVPLDGGEPPGADPDHAPRPAGATRLLSAKVDGAPFGVTIYTARGSASQVLGHYDAELPKQGWAASEVVARNRPSTRLYRREGVELFVVAEGSSEQVSLSLLEMPQKGP